MVSRKRAKFQPKIVNFMVVGARQGFQSFRQKAWFPGNNRALSKFLYGVLHYLTRSPVMGTLRSSLLNKKPNVGWFLLKRNSA